MRHATKSAEAMARMHGIHLDAWFGSGRDGQLRKCDIDRIIDGIKTGGGLEYIERGRMCYIGRYDREDGWLLDCGQPGLQARRIGGAA